MFKKWIDEYTSQDDWFSCELHRVDWFITSLMRASLWERFSMGLQKGIIGCDEWWGLPQPNDPVIFLDELMAHSPFQKWCRFNSPKSSLSWMLGIPLPVLWTLWSPVASTWVLSLADLGICSFLNSEGEADWLLFSLLGHLTLLRLPSFTRPGLQPEPPWAVTGAGAPLAAGGQWLLSFIWPKLVSGIVLSRHLPFSSVTAIIPSSLSNGSSPECPSLMSIII